MSPSRLMARAVVASEVKSHREKGIHFLVNIIFKHIDDLNCTYVDYRTELLIAAYQLLAE